MRRLGLAARSLPGSQMLSAAGILFSLLGCQSLLVEREEAGKGFNHLPHF